MPQITRKALDEMNAELERLRIVAALHWTDPVKHDVPPPKSFEKPELTKGYLFNSYDTGSVSRACSSSVNHCSYSDEKTTTQRPCWLYSTELLAWKACRAEMEMNFAKKLAAVDKKIAELQAIDLREPENGK